MILCDYGIKNVYLDDLPQMIFWVNYASITWIFIMKAKFTVHHYTLCPTNVTVILEYFQFNSNLAKGDMVVNEICSIIFLLLFIKNIVMLMLLWWWSRATKAYL